MSNKEIKLYFYECSNKDCGHSFYSSTIQTNCPKCNRNVLNCLGEKGAVILEDNEPSIIDSVKEFFIDQNIVLPKSVTIKMGSEFNREGPWEYLLGVYIEGEYGNKDNLEEELKTFINDNFTISEMKEQKVISFV